MDNLTIIVKLIITCCSAALITNKEKNRSGGTNYQDAPKVYDRLAVVGILN
jgi:hypothetical protein